MTQMTMTTNMLALQRSLQQAQAAQVQMLAARWQPAMPGLNLLESVFSRRFEQQIGRLETALDRLASMLDRLGAEIGGGACWSRPQGCGLPGGWTADPFEVIAGKGRIWGDPHFIGADGGKYDVQGEAGKIYNLLSDEGFQMNGRFDRWGSGGATVVGEVGINARGDIVRVKADGTTTVNGREVKDGEMVLLTNGGYVARQGSDVMVQSGEWKVDFQANASRNGDYLNMDVSTHNAVSDGVRPHGLLGQTFDGDGVARNGDKGAGAQGGGAIETLAYAQTARGDTTTVRNYEVASLTDTTFTAFNRFGTQAVSPFDSLFGGGFGAGWGASPQALALGAFGLAYSALALSLAGSGTPFRQSA